VAKDTEKGAEKTGSAVKHTTKKVGGAMKGDDKSESMPADSKK
jgi:hypothetical protein